MKQPTKNALWTMFGAASLLIGQTAGDWMSRPGVSRPALSEAITTLEQSPARLKLLEECLTFGEGYRIYLDTVSGKQILYKGGALLVLPEADTPVSKSITELLK